MENKEKKIKCLTLLFPVGITVEEVQKIISEAQNHISWRVSAGGFTPKDPHFTTYSDEDMLYEFGHRRKEESK